MRTIPMAMMALALTAGIGCARKSEPATSEATTPPKEVEASSPAEPRAAASRPATAPDAEPRDPGRRGRGWGPPPDKPCPMTVPDTEARYEDVERGGALVFSTTGDDQVAELRRRLHAWADYHNEHHRQGMAMGRGRGRGPGRGMGPRRGRGMGPGAGRGMGPGRGRDLGPMPAAEATVVEVESGARFELLADEEGDVERVRAHVRYHHDRMRAGRCPRRR